MRHASAEGALSENFGERVRERTVAAVDHQQLDVLVGELPKGIRHGLGVRGLDMRHIGWIPEEVQQLRDLIAVAPRAQVIQ